MTSSILGNLADTTHAGGIENTVSGVLTLINSTVARNRVVGNGPGGGILNAGTLTLINSTISGNSTLIAHGDGIENSGSVALQNTILAGNLSRVTGED
jgi:hypothetical protein